MVKKFTANCDFGGQKSPVNFYVGNPATGNHPLNFQSKWLANTRGGVVPADIMESFKKLAEVAEKNRIPFEELCSYVIDELKSMNTLATDASKAKSLAAPQNSKPQISKPVAPQPQVPQQQAPQPQAPQVAAPQPPMPQSQEKK